MAEVTSDRDDVPVKPKRFTMWSSTEKVFLILIKRFIFFFFLNSNLTQIWLALGPSVSPTHIIHVGLWFPIFQTLTSKLLPRSDEN